MPKEKVDAIFSHFKGSDDDQLVMSDFESFWTKFVKPVSERVKRKEISSKPFLEWSLMRLESCRILVFLNIN